jgi:UDP-N-acetylmuramyl tripeptide synthase
MGKLPLRARLATTVGGAAGRMSRLSGRGDGSVIGGVVGLRMEPDLVRLLAVGRQIVLVTGTNGKTTTTRLIAAALGALGQEVASNAFGANMEAGLVSALGQAPNAPFGVLEVDERYLPAIIEATSPAVVTLLNLSRDQMDRAAEIWLVARRWREALAAVPDVQVVANADDPLIVWAAGTAKRVTWVAAGQRWHEDSWCCAQCGSHLRRDDLGWRCDECGFTRPAARWVLDGDSVIDANGRVRELALTLPGRANRSNAVVALAVADYATGGWCGCCWPRTRPAGWRRSTSSPRRRPRCCWPSTRGYRTARTRPGCGTWTTGCCAAAPCWSPASAGSI